MIVLVNAMIPLPGETPGQWWGDDRRRRKPAEATDEAAGREHGVRPGTRTSCTTSTRAVARSRANPSSARRRPTPFGQPCAFERWPDVADPRARRPRRPLLPGSACQRRVARERLGIEADEIAGGHLVALSNPGELARRLSAYAADPSAEQSRGREAGSQPRPGCPRRRPRRCQGSASLRPIRGPWRAPGRRHPGRARSAAAVGRVRALAGARLGDREAGQRGHQRDRPPRDLCASRATRRRPRSRRAGSSRRARGRRVLLQDAGHVGRGLAAVGDLRERGRRRRGARPLLLDRVAQAERRRARDDDPAAHAAHRHVVGERAADAPRPRAGGDDDVRPRCGPRR